MDELNRVLTDRPRLNSVDKAQVVSRAVAWRGGSLARRVGRRFLRQLTESRS